MGLLRKQIILVGDSACGKSALTLRLTHALFAESYIPTTFESRSTVIETTEGNTKLVVQDTTGGKDGHELRKLAYEGCHGVVICFDLTNERSYQNIETRWMPEIRNMAPAGIPVFLAGCKKDLADDDTERAVTSELDVQELVQRIGALAYFECSAYTNENVDKLFKDLAEAKTQKQKSNMQKALDTVMSLRKIL